MSDWVSKVTYLYSSIIRISSFKNPNAFYTRPLKVPRRPTAFTRILEGYMAH